MDNGPLQKLASPPLNLQESSGAPVLLVGRCQKISGKQIPIIPVMNEPHIDVHNDPYCPSCSSRSHGGSYALTASLGQVAVLSRLFLAERLTVVRVVAVLLAFAGAKRAEG